MNVAFLLVTTAWLTGADPIPVTTGGPALKPAPAVTAPVAAPMVGGGSCSSCSSCGTTSSCGCEEEGFCARLRERLRGLFTRSSCDTCNTCATPTCSTCAAPACSTCAAPTCSSCAPHAHYAPVATCNTCNTCNTCEESWCSRLKERLRGLFQHNNDCGCGCATPTTTGCCGSAAPVMAAPVPPMGKVPEGIPAPMPPGKEPPMEKAPPVDKGAPVPEKKGAFAPINPANPVPVNTPAFDGAPAIVTPPALEPKRDF